MKIGFFVFPKFQLLDLAGPLAAFEIAQRFYDAPYKIEVVSIDGGMIKNSLGTEIMSQKLSGRRFDTLIVMGGDDMNEVCQNQATKDALKRHAATVRRMASICTGAYLLAETGLLKGRKVTTHWRFAGILRDKHPDILLDPDKIFIKDGKFWSSAGISAGIDLSLALLEDDVGEDTAKLVAQDLVVYYRRPGGQSQYSALLEVDARSERVSMAMNYARQNLNEAFTVEDLAHAANLSPRQFARVFKEETGQTPAKAVEQLRAETARVRIENNPSESFSEIAEITGFGDVERMRRCFVRLFGASPQAIRRSLRSS